MSIGREERETEREKRQKEETSEQRIHGVYICLAMNLVPFFLNGKINYQLLTIVIFTIGLLRFTMNQEKTSLCEFPKLNPPILSAMFDFLFVCC